MGFNIIMSKAHVELKLSQRNTFCSMILDTYKFVIFLPNYLVHWQQKLLPVSDSSLERNGGGWLVNWSLTYSKRKNCSSRNKVRDIECILLNTTYKILSRPIDSDRIKIYIEKIVGKDKAGFMRGWSMLDQVYIILKEMTAKCWEFKKFILCHRLKEGLWQHQ